MIKSFGKSAFWAFGTGLSVENVDKHQGIFLKKTMRRTKFVFYYKYNTTHNRQHTIPTIHRRQTAHNTTIQHTQHTNIHALPTTSNFICWQCMINCWSRKILTGVTFLPDHCRRLFGRDDRCNDGGMFWLDKITSDTLKGGAKKPELAKVLCENSGADVECLLGRLGGHSASHPVRHCFTVSPDRTGYSSEVLSGDTLMRDTLINDDLSPRFDVFDFSQ